MQLVAIQARLQSALGGVVTGIGATSTMMTTTTTTRFWGGSG